MINWFKRNNHSKYREIILASFPKEIKKDVEIVLNMIPFDINEVKLCDGQPHKLDNLIHPDRQTVYIEKEEIKIPYRVYFNEPETNKVNKLTNNQKAILNCIFLRHHNGFVRQRHLENLKNDDYWITPFTFQLLGEYIFEIIEILYTQLNDDKLENYKKFVIENPKYYQQTESRMISYWNEYYRRNYPKLNLYLGRILFDLISATTFGKRLDEIIEVGINETEQLFIKPKNESFILIYRTATEVHWNEKNAYLYSPKPREWSYFDWYQHILNVVNVECNFKLILTHKTKWTNIPNELKKQITKNKKSVT